MGMVLGRALARLEVRQACQLDLRDFLLSHIYTTKGGFIYRTPPLFMRTAVPSRARYVIMPCHAAVLCMIRPNRSSVCRSCGPLKRQNPLRPLLLLFAIVLG